MRSLTSNQVASPAQKERLQRSKDAKQLPSFQSGLDQVNVPDGTLLDVWVNGRKVGSFASLDQGGALILTGTRAPNVTKGKRVSISNSQRTYDPFGTLPRRSKVAMVPGRCASSTVQVNFLVNVNVNVYLP
jgi:hypothetical protein